MEAVANVIGSNEIAAVCLAVFAGGMGAALNPDEFREGNYKLMKFILSDLVLNNKYAVNQHTLRNLSEGKATMAYRTLRAVMAAALYLNILVFSTYMFGYNEVTNVNRILHRVFYATVIWYAYRTYHYTLHDILLDDDKSVWSLNKRRQHVLYPFEIGSKIKLPKKLRRDEAKMSLKFLSDTVGYNLMSTGGLGLALLGAHKVLPGVLYPLMFIGYLPFYDKLMKTLGQLYQMAHIYFFREEYDGIFFEYLSLVKSGEGYENWGRQYHYFRRLCIPLQDQAKSLAYSTFKKDFGVGGGKAGSVFTRGLIVVGMLFAMGFVNTQGALWMLTYYATHAGVMFWNHSQPDHFDSDFTRLVALIAEGLFSSCMWYYPLVESVFGKMNEAAPAGSGVWAIST